MSSEQVQPRNIGVTALLSVVLAAVSLVVFVLPAEYNIDPTGLGKRLGIDGMSGYAVSALSKETQPFASDEVAFPLAPFESIEYKYNLEAGQAMVYSWVAEGEVVFDFHSEEQGTEPEDAVSFDIGRAASGSGTYVAPYSGIHGWFWENRGQQEVTVRLSTTGYYTKSTTFGPSGAYEREISAGE